MVLAHKFTSKQVRACFFTLALDEQDGLTSCYRCQCSTIRKQDPITGYSNLLSHVRQKSGADHYLGAFPASLASFWMGGFSTLSITLRC
ncbi:hypothetical protein JG688_00015141 [Phytophthora aleatoria]|uniref:BED-type domain-containing protein n=1 Tax=Phytophthora aleatoria TaxID=2496075 RepID=A0A8J5IKD2_9STRA|nr:hypothetical protein JG688_00015141 [Phytophthora aleatoria]